MSQSGKSNGSPHRPTVSGYYWYRDSPNVAWVIGEVEPHWCDDKPMKVIWPGSDCDESVADFDGEWRGPIEPPTDSADGKAEKPEFRPFGKSWAEANAETRKERWVCELDDLRMRLDEGNASNAEIECYRALMPFEMLRRIVLAGQGQAVCPHEVVRLFFALRGHDYTAKADGDFVWLSCCTDDEPMTRVPSAAFLQGVDRVANAIVTDK